MVYVKSQPPVVNGLCAFADDEMLCMAVATKLDEIRTAHVPSEEYETATLFYITATYNRDVAETPIDEMTDYPYINGNTASFCLAMLDEPSETMEV